MENQMDILKKYNTNPVRTGDKYQEYSRVKNELYDNFGEIAPDEYDLWVSEVIKILDI